MTDVTMIYPGTTPTLTFDFPSDIDPSNCRRIVLLLTQGEQVIVRKENDHERFIDDSVNEFFLEHTNPIYASGIGEGRIDAEPGVDPASSPLPPYKYDDFAVSGQTITVTLTQQDTMSFAPYPTIGLELWVKTGSGKIPDPWMTSLPIGRVRNKEAL